MEYRVVVTEGYRGLPQFYHDIPVTASPIRPLAIPAILSPVRYSLATLSFYWAVPEL